MSGRVSLPKLAPEVTVALATDVPTPLPLPPLPSHAGRRDLVITATADRAGAEPLRAWHVRSERGQLDRPVRVQPLDARAWQARGLRRLWLTVRAGGGLVARGVVRVGNA